jgi:hypothetical protein
MNDKSNERDDKFTLQVGNLITIQKGTGKTLGQRFEEAKKKQLEKVQQQHKDKAARPVDK